VLLLLAIALIAVSGDLLYHDLALYRLHAVAKSIRFGEPVTTTELAQVLPQAISWDRDGALNASDLDDAALAMSLFAERNRSSFLAPSLFLTAEKLLKERLAKAPADGNSWLRLAYIRTEHVGMDTLAHDALRMSWEVTPREYPVMWPSLKFRVDHWSQMTVQEQFAAADQVTGLWHKPPERAALRAYLAKLPPQLRSTLLADMTDSQARSAVMKP
jgi:hypothetical protein